MGLHALQRRWLAEDLARRRRSDEERRYAAPQRAGHVDPNPHQIEAVIFALSRLTEGGCILADEVGLGKTIEAGLVIAQLRAEGAGRVLLVTPKPLVGQWREELYNLFAITARDASGDGGLDGEGVFIIGREAAGSERGHAALLAAPPFDLLVIDEAHEVFGGLYRRFDATGDLRGDAPVARTAGRVFDLVRASATPVLLLTATPMQNSLTELWALVRFVDPTGTLLGELPTFRQTFCSHDDRVLVEGQAAELRRRIALVLRRTLRRQAQEFLARKFVDREARLFRYDMSPRERSLYDDVTAYLLTPNLAAFRGSQRRLLLLGFHRRMASSTAALASSLEKVAERLERLLRGDASPKPLEEELFHDLDGEELLDALDDDDEAARERARDGADGVPTALTPEAIAAELERVRGFVARAHELRGEKDGKSTALLEAAQLVLSRGREGKSSGKMVIFTESVVTQEYVRALLLASGLYTDGEVTLFRGTNDGPRAKEALERWWQEVGERLEPDNRPSRDVATRLALVHELHTRSKVMIATEAGAKGLNLQFCETVVNFDLPWNPQRIEQRIGRCHRYGQTRTVTVINFLARGNETAELTFEILSKKLDLFGTVLDASDAVLHRPGAHAPALLTSALGTELESSLRRIWERARSIEEVEAEHRELRDRFDERRRRFDEQHARTESLIETWFDDDVRRVFARRRDELPAALAALDRDLERLVVAHLEALGVTHQTRDEDGERRLAIAASPALPGPLTEGLTVAIGASRTASSLHLAHPLVKAAIAAARQDAPQVRAVSARLPDGASSALRERRGRRARWVGLLVRFDGLESVDRLLPIALFEGEVEPLAPALAIELLAAELRDLPAPLGVTVPAADVEDALAEAVFVARRALAEPEGARFDRSLEQLERYIEDRLLVLGRRRRDTEERRLRAEGERAGAIGLDARERADERVVRLAKELEGLEAEVERLLARDDDTYRRCRDRLHARRFAAGRATTLFDVELVLE